MSIRSLSTRFAARVAAVLAVAALVGFSTTAHAQFIQRSVAGVWIDADGMLRNPQIDERNELVKLMGQALRNAPADLNGKVELRKISLRRLQDAIAENKKTGLPLTDEIKYLAGLQQIRYVFVYPEINDIVLAGPGEGWKVGADGEVVGVSTGRAVMLLDDLLVALRSADSARQGGISCSIDPTAEGLQQLQALTKKLKVMTADAPVSIERALGQQTISLNGVPEGSHFGRVIVAADYKMKRLAMNLDKSPIKGMPSYLEMVKPGSTGLNNAMPRWWLAPNYDSLLVSPDGLAYEIRGAAVKAVAEEDIMADNGGKKSAGKVSPTIRKWADGLTAHYDELSKKDVVFGQLRNCIDLALVAALLQKDQLPEKASFSMAGLLNAGELPTDQFHTPKQVASIASVIAKGSKFVISASGGVQIESWAMASKTEASPAVAPVRDKSAPDGKRWWWN